MRSKTALLEAQMNVTIDGILVVDDRQKRILANRRIIKLFDVPRHVLENEDDAVLLEHVVGLAKNPDEFIEKVRYLYAHTAEIGRDEIEFKSGMILDRYSAPVIGVDGKNYGRIWIFRDITERKQAEKAVLDAVAAKATSEADKRRVAEIENAYEELERTKDMLAQYDKLAAVGELSAGVAHELNSPLTGILGIVRYYLRHKKPDDREYGDLKEVEEACERMSKIIRELLDFARPSMTERGQLDASRIIDSVLAFSKKAISEKGIELTANFEENLPPIRGNKSQLQQVCLNIVNNAVEAMSEKGELRISVKTVTVNGKNYVEMEFTDNGCGIDKENLGRVFNPFFTTKRPGKGTGLGLSIAYTIIKKHAGEIMAESPPAGHSIGTTFKIRIPEAVSAADEALGG